MTRGCEVTSLSTNKQTTEEHNLFRFSFPLKEKSNYSHIPIITTYPISLVLLGYMMLTYAQQDIWCNPPLKCWVFPKMLMLLSKPSLQIWRRGNHNQIYELIGVSIINQSVGIWTFFVCPSMVNSATLMCSNIITTSFAVGNFLEIKLHNIKYQ